MVDLVVILSEMGRGRRDGDVVSGGDAVWGGDAV